MFLRISLAFGMLTLAACSGSGRYLDTGGKMCANNYMPMSLTLTGQKVRKISIEPTQGDLTAAQYVYNGADVFYYDPQQNIRIFFQDVWSTKKKNFVIQNGCVSGLKPNQDFSAALMGVSSIDVESSMKSTFKVRSYEVVMKNKQLKRYATNGQAQPDDTPSKVFDNELTEYNFYQVNDANYELRVKAVSPTTGQQMWLAIRYVKQPWPEEKIHQLGNQQLDQWLKAHPLDELAP